MDKRNLLLLCSIFVVTACGQDVSRSPLSGIETISPIVVDPGPGGNPSSPFGEILGKYSFSVSVNRAILGIDSDETENRFALLRTLSGLNSPGAYYGVGLGNQAQIGFGLSSAGLKVAAFQGLRFKAFELLNACEEETHVRLKLVVDLNCEPLNPEYRVITTPFFIPRKKETWTAFEIKPEDEIYRFDRSSPPARSLKKLLANFPRACFFAGDPFDFGMKRDQKLAPFQLNYGDRFHIEPSSVRIDDIELTVDGEVQREDFES